jgi:hypothetical protein
MKKVMLILLVTMLVTGVQADIVSGLQVHYDFEGTAGSQLNTVTDVSGNGYHGTGTEEGSGVVDVFISNDSERGNVAEFNMIWGTTHIDIPDAVMNASVGSGPSDWKQTISYWAKNHDYGWGYFLSSTVDSTTATGFPNVRAHHGYYDNALYYDGLYGARTTAPGDFADWHHYTLVGEYGVGMKIYIDGALAASTTTHNGYVTSTDFAIGGLGSIPDFVGKIDDFRVYNRALSEADVVELYEVPEPMTVALLGFGGLIALKRKRS